nr:ankyrin repeat domain-containing protein 24-like [Aegilops tauschii subsp. strangulata]
MPSVALLRHLFFLRVSDGHVRGCANFVASGKANLISNTGKRADNIRAKWVMMDAKCIHPRLEYPPCAFTPLFLRKDWEPLVASKPTFDARGLLPPVLSGAPAAPKPLELSSNEYREREEEEVDSEATPEEMGETSPLSKAEILRALSDDAEVDACQEGGELPVIPRRSRSSLIPRDAASALTPPGAASGPSAAPSSTPGVRAPMPQASRLSGFKLPNRSVEYAVVDQPMPSANKRKGDTTAVPPSAVKGGGSTRPSPVALARPRGASSGGLREDLLGADPRLVAGHLELASGWLHSDSVVRATLNQATASSKKEKQSTVKAAADRDAALKDAEAARGRCQELEDELKRLRDQLAEETRGRQVKEEEMRAREDAIKNRDADLEELEKTQAVERSRLEELEREVKAKEADLDIKAKVLVEDRAAFADLEESHLHLHDPSARLDELLEPVVDEHYTAAAAAVQGQVEALLKKFRGFASAPVTRGDTTKGGVPSSGIDGVQG